MHTLAITEQGLHVHVEGETLLLRRGEHLVRRVRLAEVSQVLLFGQVEVTSGAVAALVRRRVDVVYLTKHGSFRARLVGPDGPAAALRLAQLRRALEPAFCQREAQGLAVGKIQHQRQLLLRAQRRLADPELTEVLGRLRLLVAPKRRTWMSSAAWRGGPRPCISASSASCCGRPTWPFADAAAGRPSTRSTPVCRSATPCWPRPPKRR